MASPGGANPLVTGSIPVLALFPQELFAMLARAAKMAYLGMSNSVLTYACNQLHQCVLPSCTCSWWSYCCCNVQCHCATALLCNVDVLYCCCVMMLYSCSVVVQCCFATQQCWYVVHSYAEHHRYCSCGSSPLVGLAVIAMTAVAVGAVLP